MQQTPEDDSQSAIVDPARLEAQERGRAAEELAATFLTKRGVRILLRNMQCRRGEIDIIGLDGDTLIFVEVRLRGNNQFGGAAGSINRRKQEKIIHAATWWLTRGGQAYAKREMRFDTVLLERLEARQIIWLKNAFEAF
jgi:putative endonuclease